MFCTFSKQKIAAALFTLHGIKVEKKTKKPNVKIMNMAFHIDCENCRGKYIKMQQ
jgi:hypothetical protein